MLAQAWRLEVPPVPALSIASGAQGAARWPAECSGIFWALWPLSGSRRSLVGPSWLGLGGKHRPEGRRPGLRGLSEFSLQKVCQVFGGLNFHHHHDHRLLPVVRDQQLLPHKHITGPELRPGVPGTYSTQKRSNVLHVCHLPGREELYTDLL